MYQIKLKEFEGPLELLLQLIEKEKLEITKLSLAKVADQYLKYISQLEEVAPEELVDFLYIAAKLLYLKSKSLFPALSLEEEEEISLEKQLKIYKEFFLATKLISKIINQKKFIFFRETLFKEEIIFSPPPGISKEKMQKTFLKIIKELQEFIFYPKGIVKRTISIREKIEYIKKTLFSCVEDKICFSRLLENVGSRLEIIVNFLALLELVKQRIILVEQEKRFAEIKIKKYD